MDQKFAPPMRDQLGGHLYKVLTAFCGHTNMRPGPIGRMLVNGSDLFAAIDKAGPSGEMPSITIRMYDRIAGHFSAVWPADLDWPSDVPRPAPLPLPPESGPMVQQKIAEAINGGKDDG